MSTALATIDINSITMLGRTLAKSGYFQDAREEAQAIVKILAGAEMSMGPIASMTGIHIINGKPTLSANLIAATIKRSGKYDYRVLKHDHEGCEIVFFENREEIGRSTFTLEDAQASGALTGKNAHTWKAYGRNMMFARAISNGARWYCPDIFGGPVYMPEELGAPVDGEGEPLAPRVVDVQPAPTNVDRKTGEVIDAPAKVVQFDAGKARTKIKRLWAEERDLTDRLYQDEDERRTAMQEQNEEIDFDLTRMDQAQLTELGGAIRLRVDALKLAVEDMQSTDAAA